MGDSDEEHDRSKNRDKFRRERNDYGDKPRSRTDYRDRRTWRDEHDNTVGRRRNREEFEEERERRRHSSPGRARDWSPPPHKRMRREPWEGFRGFPPDMIPPFGLRGPWIPPDMPGHHIPGQPGGHPSDTMSSPSLRPKRNTMLSFVQFLTQQDDSIDETQAIQLYRDYKSDFKRKQIIEFFDDHKEEDWLIGKYHPKHISAREEVQKASLQSRLKAFQYLFDCGRLEGVSLSAENVDDVINTMDAGVILMEGGSKHDLLSLVNQPLDTPTEKKEESEMHVKDEMKQLVEQEEKDAMTKEKSEVKKDLGDSEKTLFMEVTDEQRQLAKQARMYGEQMQAISGTNEVKKKKDKPKRDKIEGDQYSYTEDKTDGSSDESEAEIVPDEPPPPGLEPPATQSDVQAEAVEKETEQNGQRKPDNETPILDSNDDKKSGPPKPLHSTKSVYIRHLPPKIAAEDIVEICRTIPGYLRIAFADPDPSRGYERRGWVTYSYNTDIREVTARLTTIKVKDIQLNCMVNRELTRRVKFGQEVAWASRPVSSDILVTLDLVKALDKKAGLWEHAMLESAELKLNPVVTVPASLLSEEPMSGGTLGDEEEGVVSDPGTEILSENDEMVKALDRIIWYLRLVHSIDFYNCVSFPSEDCMPHRCGIFTVRPVKPNAVTQDEVTSYVESTKSRVKRLLQYKREMSNDDMEKYGKKDADAEVERFIEVNTQRLAENKYLCPLSGKKFKGPDFVHKHIFNKHSDKVDAVKQETEYFNNYLRDLDRPGQQEGMVETPNSAPIVSQAGQGGVIHLDERPAISPVGQSTPGGWGQPPQMMFARGGFGPAMGGFPPGMIGGRGGFRSRGSRRGRGRKVVHYHDLDAPDDMY